MPARRAKATDKRGLGGLFVNVQRLRIVSATEGDDFFLGNRLRAELVRFLDLEVFVVQFVRARGLAR